MSTEPDWRELETNGFVVVRSFLSDSEIATLRADFSKGAPPSSYPHGFKLIKSGALDAMWPKIGPATREIRKQTSLTVDLIAFLTFSHYVVTERTERTSFWHQDFDFDYKVTRDHLNYLNFYVPILKPEIDKSNVCVVPYEALRTKSSDAFAKLHGSGGHRLVPKDGTTCVYGNYGAVLDGEREPPPLFELDFDIEDLMVAPALAAGDLLVMRGDLIHRTQDATTSRISASIRVTYSKKIIHRDRLTATTPSDSFSQLEGLLLRCFDTLNKTEITVEELVSFANGMRPTSSPS